MAEEKKNIEIGKFYFIHVGSKTGHLGFVVWKDVGIILPNLHIHQDDMRLIKQILQRNPEMSPSLRR